MATEPTPASNSSNAARSTPSDRMVPSNRSTPSAVSGEDCLLDIGDVAARSGLAASALRFYEHEGIIASTERKGLRRQFPSEVLTTLAVVAMCRRAGFTLDETRTVLATRGDVSWKTFAARKRDQLRSQAAHLSAMADQLDHALRCPSPNVFDCEHFRAALDRALPVEDGTPARFGAPGIDG
jgi:DNA-binding transcriptional MerR regulator